MLAGQASWALTARANLRWYLSAWCSEAPVAAELVAIIITSFRANIPLSIVDCG